MHIMKKCCCLLKPLVLCKVVYDCLFLSLLLFSTCFSLSSVTSVFFLTSSLTVISHSHVSANTKMNQTEISVTDLFITRPEPRPVKNTTHRTVSRPDWILYTVPASAFLIGIFLFTFICKTQRHRKTHVAKSTYRNKQVDNYTSFRHSTDSVQSKNTKKKDDAQSYENVEAAIYTNQEKVTYYVSADQDYITPEEVNEQDGIGPRPYQDNLQLPQNLTDTDGESYENMANLYAQPRKCSQQHKHRSAQEGDYVYPDQDGQDVTNTDTGSYEMMADSHCSYEDLTHNDYINPDDDGQKDFTFDHTDTDSYEQMNGIPFQIGMN
ncbi:uncharacterized protein LOC130426554 [Triplophysa dalaica]|uniref:uncharacterized protein LOC130426554 n=1 Tax=Triplophysa dalaica TaxID=1582913 RepID=UPI0024DF73F9|nr:uncharacterized protein LOC130426554 [Triplophysa dalaica]